MSATATAPRWSLTRNAFECLLERLRADSEEAAREYNALRGKLIDFFEARGLPSAEALADETLDRVARRLEQGEDIKHLRGFIYGVARRLILESAKRRAREQAALRVRRFTAPTLVEPGVDERVACLEHCLHRLPHDSQVLIVEYYQEERASRHGRQKLAEQLGITYVSLRTRAHRVRRQLEADLRACVQGHACDHQSQHPAA
jgi:DNA-directed RNA polymerase specialized sigma24 family protein